MRRLLSGGLMMLAGAVGPSTLSPHQAFRTASMYRSDARLEALRHFFQKFDCPAEAYAIEFLEAADTYKLDWRLLPSISFVESAGGKAAPHNNIFGWDNGRAHFTSPAAGIYEVGYTLAYSDTYRNKDLDTVLTIYNPVGPYARAVKSVMQQITTVHGSATAYHRALKN
jgi:hypothetical protein